MPKASLSARRSRPGPEPRRSKADRVVDLLDLVLAAVVVVALAAAAAGGLGHA